MPKRTDIHKVLIIGSGPIIIGQACEFDYSGTQACKALKKLGYEIVLVNSNPATIMTDPETADVTYIEPLNVDRLEQIIKKERPDALLPNLGGQSGLNLCAELYKAGILDKYNVKVIGVQVDAIERGEDRIEFKKAMNALGIEMARSEVAYSVEEALKIADELGYPVLVRPSYVLGGQGMEIAYKEADVREFMQVITRNKVENPVLVDKYMMGREIEVDAICDGDDILIPGIMEHFERAGVHSGDSISIYPSINIEQKHKDTLVKYTEALAKNLAVLGLVNIQFVLYNDQIYVIEVNPRSSRTVPYISKVTGVPMVDLAVRYPLHVR